MVLLSSWLFSYRAKAVALPSLRMVVYEAAGSLILA
jgi:hypothetical protein